MKELMKLSHTKNKRRIDANRSPPSFKEGDLVLIERPTHRKGATTKLLYTYIGPYRIAKKLSDVSYAIANIRGRAGTSVVHSWHLRPFVCRTGDIATDPIYQNYVPGQLPPADQNLRDNVTSSEEARASEADIGNVTDDEDDLSAILCSPMEVAAYEDILE